MPLAAPTNVTAVVSWSGGLPRVTVSWTAVSGASSYMLVRYLASSLTQGGRVIGAATASTSAIDIPANSQVAPRAGYDYYYKVVARTAGRVFGIRSNPVIAQIPATDPGTPSDSGPPPTPTPGPLPFPPTNLRVSPFYSSGKRDTLTWDAVSGADSYKVYLLEGEVAIGATTMGPTLLATVTAPTVTYNVTTAQWQDGSKYFVTTIDGGIESIPCAIASCVGGFNPSTSPNLSHLPAAPGTPVITYSRAEWNNGVPRNYLEWETRGSQYSMHFKVYRDGTLITGAGGINRPYFIDTTAVAGVTYAYKVKALFWTWSNGVGSVETTSSDSNTVNITTRTAAPSAMSNSFTATQTSAGSYSGKISVTPLPSPVLDYRAYPTSGASYEGSKYSGGATTFELNGMTTGTGYTVEALDKPGPFMFHERHPPGHHEIVHTNGQGDPSNVPNVLRSTTVTVTPSPITLSGSQTFLEDSGARNADFGLTQITVPTSIASANGLSSPLSFSHNDFRSYSNANWFVHFLNADMMANKIFVASKHPMTVMADGGTAGSSNAVRHVTEAAIMLQLRNTVSLATSTNVLHFTWQSDPHVSGRRWFSMMMFDSADTITSPNHEFSQMPTTTGKHILWSVFADVHRIKVGTGASFANLSVPVAVVRPNGTMQDLDRRVRYDFYFRRSDNKVRIVENGVTFFDGTIDSGFALNSWTAVGIALTHKVYHSSLDLEDNIQSHPENAYWISHRKHMDERHWQDMGIEVLTAFP